MCGGDSDQSEEEGVASEGKGDEAHEIAGDIVERTKYASYIDGMEVKWVPGRCDERWTYSSRLAIKCSNPAHIGCNRSRSVTLLEGVLGSRAPEAFLGAWLREGHSQALEKHRSFRPSLAMQRVYLDSSS